MYKKQEKIQNNITPNTQIFNTFRTMGKKKDKEHLSKFFSPHNNDQDQEV